MRLLLDTHLLLAQAIVEGVALVTADAAVAAYPAPIIRV